MKPPEPLENTPIFHGKALWTVLERYRICMVSQTFVREKLKAKHRARQENVAALVGRWIDGHSRFCWCPFFYAQNQVQKGRARLGWTPWAASSFRGSGGRSLPIAALFFMQQPEHLCRCSCCSSKQGPTVVCHCVTSPHPRRSASKWWQSGPGWRCRQGGGCCPQSPG